MSQTQMAVPLVLTDEDRVELVRWSAGGLPWPEGVRRKLAELAPAPPMGGCEGGPVSGDQPVAGGNADGPAGGGERSSHVGGADSRDGLTLTYEFAWEPALGSPAHPPEQALGHTGPEQGPGY